MKIISSKDNSIYKEIKRLKEKKFRREKSKFFIEGLRFFQEAIQSGYNLEYALVKESQYEKYYELVSEALEEDKIIVLKDGLFNEICDTENPQGIAAVVSMKDITPCFQPGFYVLVDKVQDPGNLGTIIRSAHGSGALGVILTKGTVDLYNEKTLRSTMGSIFYIPVIEDVKAEFLNNLKSQNFKFVISSLQTDKNYYDLALPEKTVLCVGNEGKGISKEIEALADYKIKIPMPGGAESLNVAVASSIMMFEAVRQMLNRG